MTIQLRFGTGTPTTSKQPSRRASMQSIRSQSSSIMTEPPKPPHIPIRLQKKVLSLLLAPIPVKDKIKGLNKLLVANQKAQQKVIREMESLAEETGFPLSELEEIPKPSGGPDPKANLEYKKRIFKKMADFFIPLNMKYKLPVQSTEQQYQEMKAVGKKEDAYWGTKASLRKIKELRARLVQGLDGLITIISKAKLKEDQQAGAKFEEITTGALKGVLKRVE